LNLLFTASLAGTVKVKAAGAGVKDAQNEHSSARFKLLYDFVPL
jgi:hypothetical protein